VTVLPGDFDETTRTRRQRRPGGKPFGVVLVALATLYAAFALWRLVASGLYDLDGNGLTVAALALTPYLAATGVVLSLFVALFRRWGSAVVVFALSAALGLTLVPRYFADGQPGTGGPVLRVMAVNLYYGEADAAAVVSLVRQRAVDVLAVTELTPAAAKRLEQAGLGEVLPHQHFQPAAAAAGSGVASRYPLVAIDLAGPSSFRQPSAAVHVEDQVVEVVAVHAMPPVDDSRAWAADLRSLPRANKEGAVRVLAGDFNATLDHAEFRRLLTRGYVDAADQLGLGMMATWPRERSLPPVTIDHVLIDSRAAVRNFQVVDLPGSDHRAILATVRLPGSAWSG